MKTFKLNQKPNWFVTTAVPVLIVLCGLFLLTGQALAAGPQCTIPYVQIQDGATGLLPDPTMQFAIESVSMGEPFVNCSTKRLTVVMKVPTMDPQNTGSAHAPPNASWTVTFLTNATSDGATREVFVQYDTTVSPAGAFNWGFHDTINDINLSQCLPIGACAVTGTVATNGTITMHFNLTSALVLSGLNSEPFGSLGGSFWTPGKILSSIQGHTDRFIGAAGTGFSIADAATAGDGVYTVAGNVSCSNPPTAALAATPTLGNAPLTVNFTATGTIPAGACGTINGYIFDYGDGTPQVTQVPPNNTASHIYTTGGTTYPARVRVTSTSGFTSAFAQQNITVNTVGPPQLSSVVSRMTHGGVGTFDIVLPQLPAARNVECRGNGTYKLVYTFLNNLTSVGGASVTAGTGSVLNSGLGPNSNQYTVNLTGVTNAQSTTVTLTNALDSTGALGSVPAVIGVLNGDTTNDGTVNSGDIAQTKSRSGATVDSSNFRSDVTVDNTLNSGDIAFVKSKSGTALP